MNTLLVNEIEKEYLNKNIPQFNVGDTLKVYVKILEGGKERVQVFEGIALRKRGGGIGATFTVRKMSQGVGVERTFLFHSPAIQKVVVSHGGKVRRAKLYYLRGKVGKKARVKRKDIR